MSGAVEIIGGIAAVGQIVTQVFQVVSLMGEIHRNMQNGPGSNQDQENMIQRVVELVATIQQNHTGDNLVKAFTDAFQQDAELLRRKLQGISINTTDSVVARLRKSLKRKSKDQEILKLERRLEWAIATINTCQGSYTNAMIADMYNVIVRKEMVPARSSFTEANTQLDLFTSITVQGEPVIGREKFLESLRLKLDLGECKSHTRVALYGLPGVGKTKIAYEYAHQLKTRETGISVFFINAETRSSFEHDYLKIRMPAATIRHPTMEDIHNMLFDQSGGEWLAVVDNVNDGNALFGPNGFFQLIPKSVNGQVIFITGDRNTAVSLAGASNIERLYALSLVEAKMLLLSRMAITKFSDEDDLNATALLAGLDYNPHLICHAGSFITANSISLTEYVRVYLRDKTSMTEHLNQVLDFDPSRGFSSNDDRISSSWISKFEVLFEKIRRESPDAADFLCFMACVSNYRIPKSLLCSESLPSQQIDKSKALQTLKAHCFIDGDENDEFFNMPNAVCLAIYKWLKEHRSFDFWVEAAFGSVYERFPDLNLDEAALTTCDAFFIHAEAVLSHEQLCLDKLTARAMLATRCSVYLQRKGHYNHAEIFAKKAAKWNSKSLGENNEKTLDYLGNWAAVLRHQGQFDKAWEIDRNVLDQRSRIQGKYHLATIATMESLASTLYGLGEFREAVKMHGAVFRIRKVILGPRDGATLVSMANLCRSLTSMENYNAAEQIGRKVITLKTEVFGVDNPSTLISKEVLGSILRRKGDPAQAEELFKVVLRARKELYGDIMHPSVLSVLGNIAGVLEDQGKLLEAELLAREVWTNSINVRGARHPDTIRSASNLSEILLRLEDFPQAEHIKRQVLKDRREVLGIYHPDTQNAEECLRRLLDIKESQNLQNAQISYENSGNQLQPNGTDNRFLECIKTSRDSSFNLGDKTLVLSLLKRPET